MCLSFQLLRELDFMSLPLHRHIGNASVHPSLAMLGFISSSLTYWVYTMALYIAANFYFASNLVYVLTVTQEHIAFSGWCNCEG